MDQKDLHTLVAIEGQFDAFADLKRLTNVQTNTLQKLKSERDALAAEVDHLKSLLTSTTPLKDNTVQLEVSTEQAVCEAQISKISEVGLIRHLSLEETKRLEIMIKSLYLIKEKNGQTLNADYTTLPSGATLDSLALIAAAPEPQPESD